jgi:phosphate transport system substrate-binding protein
MHCAPPARDREVWSRTITYLILGCICYAAPWTSVFAGQAHGAQELMRIQGSNTIGARLAPALVEGLFREKGLQSVRTEASGADNQQQVLGTSASGQQLRVSIAAHGSSTGFSALHGAQADVAASSRPIRDSELQSLSSLGDFRSAAAEQIIALDGLAVIVHPDNPLSDLGTAQLAQLFAGEIQDWSSLGGPAGPVRIYARDDNSGTYDTFKELVLSANGKSLSGAAQRFESSDRLSDSVSRDTQAIGFIGLPYIRQAKALAVRAGDSLPMPPSVELIATEDYPLSRRLFLYADPASDNDWLQALTQFAHSPAGQRIVSEQGFIGQTVTALRVAPDPQMPARYQQLAGEAQRLSVNFRFSEGSAQLDNKARRDLERLMAYLQQNDKLHDRAVLVGFGDAKSSPERAQLLSKLRAMAVRRELAREGVQLREVTGFGDELPVASNSADEGRIKNRRVEVWV